jgi:CheY-like chemotaxis protein
MPENTEAVRVVLHDTTILLVEDDAATRKTLSTMFSALGATVYEASNQMAALGIYLHLFRKRQMPRIVLADWWLVEHGGPEFKFMSDVCNGDGITSYLLLETVAKLDPHAFMVCYTGAPDDATPRVSQLANETNTVEVYNKGEICPSALVATVLEHIGLVKQREERERLLRVLSESGSAYDSGRALQQAFVTDP